MHSHYNCRVEQLRRRALFCLLIFKLEEKTTLMVEKPTYLTAAGKRKLEDELEYLRTVRRSEVAKHIQEAKEGGDITENAGYDEAKNEQAFVEGRILTLEALLARVEVIEHPQSGGAVCIGCKVTVMENDGPAEAFHIVGSAESDPTEGRISDESPLGRALLGHGVGDRVLVKAPNGPTEFEILDVS
jgi:transcription elongation factor GreA